MEQCVCLYFAVILTLVNISRQSCTSRITGMFECDAFSDVKLEHVYTVKITTSNLQKLPVIENGNNLKRLDVVKSVNEVQEHAFSSMSNLQYILMKKNEIEIVFKGRFDNLKISILNLKDNGIKKIQSGAFINDTLLKELDLSRNKIQILELKTFDNLNLEKLDLSYNLLENIENNNFGTLPRLKFLHLGHNKLIMFTSHILSHPNNLETLWLQNNSLSLLSKNMFRGMTSLRLLDVVYNSISTIEARTFQKIPNVVGLFLSYNKLRRLTGNEFPGDGLKRLCELYINFNRLTFLSSDFFDKAPNLRLTSVGGNPWGCKCLDILLNVLKQRRVVVVCDEVFLNGDLPSCIVERSGVCDSDSDEWLNSKYNVDVEKYLSQNDKCKSKYL